MSRKLLIGLIILGLVISLGIGGIYAYNEMGKNSLDKGLNLTDEQKEEIKGIMEDLRDKVKPVLEKIKTARDEERAVLDAETLDESKLENLINKNIGYINEIMGLREDAFVEIEKVLTPEQREKYLSSLGFLTGRYIRKREKNPAEERLRNRIRDWLLLAKKLNLTEEQKETLNELIREERVKFVKYEIRKKTGFLIKKLELTDEQKDSFIEMIKTEAENERGILKELKENAKNEKEIVSKDPLDETALRNSISTVRAKLNEVLSLRKDMYLNIVHLLTPEQRKNLPTSIFFLSPGMVR
ncbi:MAG: hypothetical protein DRI28_02385 [Caldiserica bacterium]|nr:MAG: hypothetical protein DRI28_02385 [Caldisericota bacterium]